MSQFCPECPMRGLCEGDIAGVVSLGSIERTPVPQSATERLPISTEIIVVVDKDGMPSQPMVHTSKSAKRELLGVSTRFETKTAVELIGGRLNKCYEPKDEKSLSLFRRNTGKVACRALGSYLGTDYGYDLSPFSDEKLQALNSMSKEMTRDALYRTMAKSLEFTVGDVA